MEKLTHYRQIITDCLRAEAAIPPSVGDIEALVVADTTSDNYLLIAVGWDRTGRVHAPIVHIRLHGDKVAIEFDGTEEGIAGQLIAAGIPPEAIVLAFVHPAERADTAFAVA